MAKQIISVSSSTRTFVTQFIASHPFYASVLLGLATIVGTHVRVPLPWSPVPLTAQPFMALIAGGLLGPWGGMLSQLIYILGLPLSFYAPIGYGVLLSPIGGYVIGVASCALWSGLLVTVRPQLNPQNLSFALVLTALSMLSSYGCGASVLYWTLGYTKGTWLSMHQLFLQGIAPFLIGDTLKALAAARIVAWYCYTPSHD